MNVNQLVKEGDFVVFDRNKSTWVHNDLNPPNKIGVVDYVDKEGSNQNIIVYWGSDFYNYYSTVHNDLVIVPLT